MEWARLPGDELTAPERHLLKTLRNDPAMAPAAYNLGVRLATDSIDKAIWWMRKAMEMNPDNPTYPYALAWYQWMKGENEAAIKTLHSMVERHPSFGEAHKLLGEIYEGRGENHRAEDIYLKGIFNHRMDMRIRFQLRTKFQALKRGHKEE